ncbi:imidazole glycerol phosphate synthase subunit HisH 2 [Bacteroidia bacterium]|nr:imidazole glycerol phosphate synthase subunit HisH 2 [Bacteroidia bacterium]
MITIVNYGSGNIKAIGNIYERLSIPFKIANTPEEIKDADKILLPGVGAFDETIAMLDDTGFRPVLDSAVLMNKIPVLGICVGMQILAEKSEEGNLSGLGWIKGEVKKIDKSTLLQKPKLPHLGWNSIEIKRKSDLFNGINEEDGFYFLHSYHFAPNHKDDMLATAFYGSELAAAVNKDNVFGVQFHPEKSHQNGIQLLKNFAEL